MASSLEAKLEQGMDLILWKRKMKEKLEKKSETVHGCRVWKGASEDRSRSKDGSLLYGMIRAKLPYPYDSTTSQKHRVHRIAFSINNSDFYDPTDSDPISHLCHNSLCINPKHLSKEPQLINNHRIKCVQQGACDGHEPHPECIL